MKVKDCIHDIDMTNEVLRTLYDYKNKEIDHLPISEVNKIITLLGSHILMLGNLKVEGNDEE